MVLGKHLIRCAPLFFLALLPGLVMASDITCKTFLAPKRQGLKATDHLVNEVESETKYWLSVAGIGSDTLSELERLRVVVRSFDTIGIGRYPSADVLKPFINRGTLDTINQYGSRFWKVLSRRLSDISTATPIETLVAGAFVDAEVTNPVYIRLFVLVAMHRGLLDQLY